MKKMFLTMLGVCAMLCSTSCSDEEIVVSGEGEAMVQFTVELDGADASRADAYTISDGTTVDKVYYEVYTNVNGEQVRRDELKGVETITGKKATVQLALVKGQAYDIVFWASKEGAYDTSDLKEIKVKDQNTINVGLANDETKDAFTAVYRTAKVTGPIKETIELTRPFAQINFGTLRADMEAAEDAGATLTVSKVKVTNLAHTYNALSEEGVVPDGAETKTVEFAYYAIPDRDSQELTFGEGVTPTYEYLATAYVLFPGKADAQVTTDLTMTVDTKLNQEVVLSVPNAPAQRNFRTNVLGNLLTNQADFNIVVDPIYVDDYPNTKEQELQFAAATGGTVTLTEDVVLTKPLTVANDLVINLNGKTISGSIHKNDGHVIVNNSTLKLIGGTVSSLAGNGGSAIRNNGTLVVEGATLNGAQKEGDGWPSYPVNNYGDMTLMNCVINGYQGAVACNEAGTTVVENCEITKNYMETSSHVFYVNHADAKVVVNGGTYVHGGFDGSLAYVNKGLFIVNDGSFKTSNGGYGIAALTNGNVEVNGGVFENDFLNWGGKIVVKGGTFKKNPSNYVAEGYATVSNADGTYTVVEGTVVSSVEDLANALVASTEGELIVLGGNIEVASMIEIPETVNAVLDLNGKTITGAVDPSNSAKHIYPINNKGVLTIKNGTVTGRGIYNQDGATLTIDGAKVVAQDTNGGACVWSYGTGEVYLNNAEMIGYTGIVSSQGYLEINGGTYTCYSGILDNGTQATNPTYNIRAYNGLKITDGTFISRHGVISVGGGEVVIEGGSYTIEFASATTSNVVYVYGDSKMTINGGDFISDNSANKADSGAAVLVYGTAPELTINAGTFIGMNGMVSGNANTVLYGGTYNTVWGYNHYESLETYIAEGYKATQNADGSWTVSAE